MIQTWHVEMAVVTLVVFSSAVLAGGWIHFLAAFAIVLSFGHAQIADRMRESQEAQPEPDVDCAWKLNWYLSGKEVCWLVFFVLTEQWTALISVPLFIAYPVWRTWWRKMHPRRVSHDRS